MFEADIETSPAKGISDSSLFVGSQDDKWDAFCLHCSEFGYADLPFAQNLEQQRFKRLVHFIDLVNQENARLFIKEGSQEWTLCEEWQPVQLVSNRSPAIARKLFHRIE